MTVPRRYRPLLWIIHLSESRGPDAKNFVAVCRRICAGHGFDRDHAFIVAGEGSPAVHDRLRQVEDQGWYLDSAAASRGIDAM